ncbi:MAG TPA: TIM barrel protein [Tepidisphaeraceae bacterium]|nr:TIM barrel protein [Tepidisphaeraceae bacterium]
MPGGRSPGRETVVSLLEQVVPVLERRDAVIAVENHFAISCADLASWCAPFPADRVGFCLDTANSLRRFETIEMVLDRLLDRALCYHVKDWRLVGSNVGFRVEGAYLGEGDLPLDPLLRRLFRRESAPRIYLENWPPATGSRRIDIETDDRFMRKSIAAMRAALDRCCPTAPARVANLGSETAS